MHVQQLLIGWCISTSQALLVGVTIHEDPVHALDLKSSQSVDLCMFGAVLAGNITEYVGSLV